MADTQFGLGPLFKQMRAAFEKRAAKGQAMPAAWGEDMEVFLRDFVDTNPELSPQETYRKEVEFTCCLPSLIACSGKFGICPH